MRIIAGEAKGRRLNTPKSDAIRPVLDQVEESIFNILFDVTGQNVLDLFAGTGAMGIEALSRGANSACFVDCSKEALKLIGTNLQKCGFAPPPPRGPKAHFVGREGGGVEKKSRVMGLKASEAISFLEKQGKTFDLIFVDPPYEKFYVNKTLNRLGRGTLLHAETIVVVEHHPKEPIGEIKELCLTDERKYGQTLVGFLKKLGTRK